MNKPKAYRGVVLSRASCDVGNRSPRKEDGVHRTRRNVGVGIFKDVQQGKSNAKRAAFEYRCYGCERDRVTARGGKGVGGGRNPSQDVINIKVGGASVVRKWPRGMQRRRSSILVYTPSGQEHLRNRLPLLARLSQGDASEETERWPSESFRPFLFHR